MIATLLETRLMEIRSGISALRDMLLAIVGLLLACSAQSGQWAANNSFSNNQGTLTYHVWVPSGHTYGGNLPLLMVLHGCSTSAFEMAQVTRFNALADREGFVVVYPDYNSQCWDWAYSINQTRDTGQPSVLIGILNQVAATYGTNQRRQYVTGFSAGAAMTAILAACNADRFAAAAIHSGGMYKGATSLVGAAGAMLFGSLVNPDTSGIDAWNCSKKPMTAMPMLVLHGSADPKVNPKNGVQVSRQFAQFNDMTDDATDNNTVPPTPNTVINQTPEVADGYPYTVSTYKDLAGNTRVQHVLVTGLEHYWSGGDRKNSTVAPETKGPNASEMVWAFFKNRVK